MGPTKLTTIVSVNFGTHVSFPTKVLNRSVVGSVVVLLCFCSSQAGRNRCWQPHLGRSYPPRHALAPPS